VFAVTFDAGEMMSVCGKSKGALCRYRMRSLMSEIGLRLLCGLESAQAP
jgi:hypothetical protein